MLEPCEEEFVAAVPRWCGWKVACPVLTRFEEVLAIELEDADRSREVIEESIFESERGSAARRGQHRRRVLGCGPVI